TRPSSSLETVTSSLAKSVPTTSTKRVTFCARTGVTVTARGASALAACVCFEAALSPPQPEKASATSAAPTAPWRDGFMSSSGRVPRALVDQQVDERQQLLDVALERLRAPPDHPPPGGADRHLVNIEGGLGGIHRAEDFLLDPFVEAMLQPLLVPV